MTGLVPFAVLVSTVRALKCRTVVGDAVKEAPLDPVQTLLDQTGDAAPLIAVYVSETKQTPKGREMLEGSRLLDIVFQIFLPETCTVTVGENVIQLDTRGLGIEVVFAAIWRQCLRALQDGVEPWSHCWNRFVMNVRSIDSEAFLFAIAGASESSGTRGAAREITLTVETADEPRYGEEAPEFWQEFAGLLAAESDYGPSVAELLITEIEAGDLPPWRIEQMSAGLSIEAAKALGIGTPDPGDLNEPPTLDTITADEQRADGTVRGTFTVEADQPAEE